jgi:NAD(P)-dependent dehydrogenase (short-subunit alcohol dehydrogenase family)
MERSGEGRIAIITGSGSGIGRACALSMLKAGWSVALAGRRSDALEKTKKSAGAEGQRALCIPTDVTDPDAMRHLFDTTVETFGRLDFLFNNAGGGTPPADPDELTFENWKKVIDSNLHGTFLGVHNAFRVMKAQSPKGGRIVNNGSISAYTPRPGSAAYTSSKHAVSGLTKTASLDGRKSDICVGQLDIGNAVSPLTERMTQGVPQANGTTMVEPRMDVDHVAQALVYMASLPLESNVQFMTVMASKMPFVGRG